MSKQQYVPQAGSGTKTYATKENAIKRAEAILDTRSDRKGLNYLIMEADDGRWVPVFIGERAIQAGLHFHAHVIA